jgi:hypothetical protein
MWGICVKQAKGTNGDYFLEIGKVYQILSEDSIGYYIEVHGWITKEYLSVQEFRESQLTKILT